MKKCPFCGHEINDKTAVICPRCKAAVTKEEKTKDEPKTAQK